jgi:hypothetical protein
VGDNHRGIEGVQAATENEHQTGVETDGRRVPSGMVEGHVGTDLVGSGEQAQDSVGADTGTIESVG